MIVLDTHAWLWWTAEPRKLSRAATQAIARADEIGVCTVSVLELARRVEEGRLKLRAPVRTWVAADIRGRTRRGPAPIRGRPG